MCTLLKYVTNRQAFVFKFGCSNLCIDESLVLSNMAEGMALVLILFFLLLQNLDHFNNKIQNWTESRPAPTDYTFLVRN